MILLMSCKVSFSKRFSSTLKHKAGVFKFLRFEELHLEASFSRRISVNGRSNRSKVRFRISTRSVKRSFDCKPISSDFLTVY